MSDGAADGLAAERTHLAWRRTALGLTAGAVAAAHLLQTYAGAAAWAVAAVGAVVAAALGLSSRRRATHRVADETGVGGRLVTVCACGLVALGVGALGFVLLQGS